MGSIRPYLDSIEQGKPFEFVYQMGDITVTAKHQFESNATDEAVAELYKNALIAREARQEKSIDGFKHRPEYMYGSNLPVSDIETTIKIGDIETQHFTNWARHSETGRVASNIDRATENVQMLRAWKSADKDGAIVTTNYLGRADTEERQNEQVQFILENELALGPKMSPSLQKNIKNDYEYTLTYVVNSLTTHGKLSDLSPLGERESLIKENNLLSQERTIQVKVNGFEYTVHVKPIHIHQNISGAGELTTHLLNDNLSGGKLEQDINKSGIAKLYQVSLFQTNGSLLVTSLLVKLDGPSKLSVRTKFIYMDILQRLLGLTAVYHCKSSVDRGGTAVAIGATNAHFLRTVKVDSIEKIDELIASEEYKKMFLAQLTRAHQETLPARFGMDGAGEIIGKKDLGLKMYGSLLTDSLPDGMTIETLWEKSAGLRKLTAIVATIAYVLFYPIVIALMATIGHLVLGFAQLVTIGTKGKDIAGRMGNFHALPYSLTPWNMDKAHHRHINYSDETMKTYALLSKARSKNKKSKKTENS